MVSACGLMKVIHSCPVVGRIEYEMDDAALFAALYSRVKAQLETEYTLVPKV
jgi:hypothetical protein